jgi:Sperm-tail PG-rich repeat
MSASKVPGPGNYNPHDSGKNKPPAFSMGLKTLLKSGNMFTPGPGAYQPKIAISKENLGNIKIGTSKRENRNSGVFVPGPGAYTLNTSLGGPAFGIGSSTRDGSPAKTKNQTPGPGYYKVPTHIANLPRYVMPDRPDNLRFI